MPLGRVCGQAGSASTRGLKRAAVLLRVLEEPEPHLPDLILGNALKYSLNKLELSRISALV